MVSLPSKIRILATFLLLTLVGADAYGADRVWAQYSVGDTTDRINYYDFWVKGSKNERDLLWPYKIEADKAQGFDIDFYHRQQNGPQFKFILNELSGSYRYRLAEKHDFKLSLGGYQIDEDNVGKSSILPTWAASVLSRFNKDFNTLFFVGRSSGVREIFVTGRVADDLTNTRAGTRIQHQFFNQFLMAKVDYIKNFLQRDVERTYFDTELMMSLMKYPHWIRVGLGYQTMDYNRQTNNYWSPTDFWAFGPRVDLAYLVKENLQVYFGGNYNWFEENKTFSGDGYYLRTGIQYGIREDYLIDASYERTESVQNNSTWTGRAFYLKFNYFF